MRGEGREDHCASVEHVPYPHGDQGCHDDVHGERDDEDALAPVCDHDRIRVGQKPLRDGAIATDYVEMQAHRSAASHSLQCRHSTH